MFLTRPHVQIGGSQNGRRDTFVPRVGNGGEHKTPAQTINEDEHAVKNINYVRLDEITRKLDNLALAQSKPASHPMGVMNFDGPAPETINGRLAMMGVVPYIVANVTSGSTMLSQFQENTPIILSASVAVILGSLVVMVQNIKPKDKENSIFTAEAELTNGRLAMIGILYALIFEGINML